MLFIICPVAYFVSIDFGLRLRLVHLVISAHAYLVKNRLIRNLTQNPFLNYATGADFASLKGPN